MSSTSKQEYMDQAEEAILHTYQRFPVVLDRGEGVYLYDTDGKKYLDFAAGIAVCGLGYHYPGFDEALKAQTEKLLHVSNLFYHVPAVHAAQKLKKVSGMDRVFFTNSGTEAIEGAIKLARKYAYLKDGKNDHEIIAMNHSFHGRSMGALSVTGNEKYQKPFRPMIGGVVFADFNDLDSVKAKINEKTCAIIMETIQGEGGIYPASETFLKDVRKLCDAHDILLILDEIQCGMGRTGAMFCWQNYGVKPDIMTVAKALGGGVPVGAFLCTEKAAAMGAGDHGTTYGGNPFVCAAADKVLDIFEQDHILEHVREVGAYLDARLEELSAQYDCITAHRGMGLMQGLELNIAPQTVINRALQQGLILISAGTNVLRFVPPLIITNDHVDEMIEKLKRCFSANLG